MRKTLSFANKNLILYGVYISGSGVFNSPVKAYDPIQIPGRDGDILGREKRLEDIEVTYPAFIYTNFKQNISDLRNYLLSKDGYQKITDTYHPDEYRMGYYAGGLEVEPTAPLDAGNFELRFMCKPQRYLTSGNTATIIRNSGFIDNPTMFYSKPLLLIYGTGSVQINDVTITVTYSNTEYTEVDCELMSAYYGPDSKNQFIELSGTDFPTLKPGYNSITTTGISLVEITPRWYIV